MKKGKLAILGLSAVLVFGTATTITACTKNNDKIKTNNVKQIEENKSETKEVKVDKFDKFAHEIGERVKTHWPHMEKVWAGHNYSEHNFVLLKLDENINVQEGYLLNAQGTKKLEKKDYESIELPQPGGYTKSDFQGKKSVIVSVDDEIIKNESKIDEIYRLGTHELVHFYHQDNIKEDENESRSIKYPIDKTPRIYREMVYKHLIEAYEKPEKQEESLGKAKFWYEKWKKEFADEYLGIKNTDIAEGTARYLENFGAFITENISEKDLKDNAIKNIKKKDVLGSADAESYELGYVAALILDQKNPKWKDNFYKSHKTLEETLLENVKVVEDKVDPTVEEKVTKDIDKYNKEAEVQLKEITEAEKDKSVAYLVLDVTNTESSVGMGPTYSYNGKEVITTYTANYKVDGKSVDTDKINIIQTYEDGKVLVSIPLPKDHEFKDGVLKANGKNLKVDSIKVKSSEENGRKIFSVTADK